MSQFANDSMTPEPIKVTRDKFQNEIPSDRPMHTETTAGDGAFHWDGNQYDDSPGKGGFGSYGVSVDSSPKVERTSVDTSRADRGKES